MDDKKKTDYEKMFIGILIVVISVGFIYSFYGNLSTNKKTSNANIGEKDTQLLDKYRTITSEGEVTFDITPKRFENGRFYFTFSANTHTFNNLNEINLKTAVTLTTDSKTVKPIIASSMIGHHNSGQIVFEIGEEPSEFIITIVGIPDVETRVFKWN